MEDTGVGEADRRDLLEKAEQNALRHLQVRHTTEIYFLLSDSLERNIYVFVEMWNVGGAR